MMREERGVLNGVDAIQTSEQDHSFAHSSVSYVLDGYGDNPYNIAGDDNANTGQSSRTETGTDGYTLTQTGDSSGTNFSLALTGSESYETDSTLNSQSGQFSQGTTGSGTYSKTDLVTTTTTTGSTNFSSQEIGSTRDGDVVLTVSGASRYGQLIGFNNTADGLTSGAGLGDFSPVGLPVLVGRASVSAGAFSTVGDDRYDYCFPAGTEVRFADGSKVRIEQTIPGQIVRMVPDDQPLSKPRPGVIVAVYRNAPARLLHVHVLGHCLRVTPNHPVYVRDAAGFQPKPSFREINFVPINASG